MVKRRNVEAPTPPVAGKLVPLKTTLELRPDRVLIEVYITKVPLKNANAILTAVRALYANYAAYDLQHLRKFAKLRELPVSVLRRLGLLHGSENQPTKADDSVLYLCVGPVTSITLDELFTHLSNLGDTGLPGTPFIATTVVPALAPTSADVAAEWSKLYWPIIYKKSNPFGPHPAIVERGRDSVLPDVPDYLAQLVKVAARGKRQNLGERIAAMVVDRSGETTKIIALAVDARWKDCKGTEHIGDGNVMAHAVLRAIGMVAQKLKAKGDKYAIRRNPPVDAHERGIFGDTPILPEEKEICDQDNINADGYLCHGLEMYVTHEPCIMCSMAILHSRFDKVIFGQRMPDTGGLHSEGNNPDAVEGLGYGLFWRKELNWSLLAWEYKEDKIDPKTILDRMIHV